MSSVLAVVSKAIFEKTAKGLQPGQVWPVDRYLSKNPGLQALATGGRLFLATVRPPDEQLWLVAVLEQPQASADAWITAPNTVATVDITALLPALRFTTGKGVSAEPGKLGMSLQTPRTLTDADVALLDAACGAVPVSVALVSVAPAQLVPVQAAPASAPTATFPPAVAKALVTLTRAPKKALTELKTALKAVGQPALVLSAWEHFAEQALAQGEAGAAAEAFSAARALERKAKVQRPDLITLALRFAQAGALECKEVATLLKGKAPLDPAQVVTLAAAVTGRGEPPTPELAELLDKRGLLTPSFAQWFRDPASLKEATPEFWRVCQAAAAQHLRDDPAAQQRALSFFPTLHREVHLYLEILAAAELGSVAAKLPTLPAYVVQLLGYAARYGMIDDARLSALARLLPPMTAALAAAGQRISLSDPHPYSDDLYPPEVVELLLDIGAPVAPPDPDRRFHFHQWAARASALPYQALTRMVADPVLREHLAESFVAAFKTVDVFPQQLLRAALVPGGAPLIAAIERCLAHLATHGTVGAAEAYLPAIERLATPEVLAAVPQLIAPLARLDAAVLLHHQLRAGLMDEWGWPAQDAAAAQLGQDVRSFDTGGPFPYLTMQAGARVVVAGPEGVVADTTLSLPNEEGWLRQVSYVGGDLLYYWQPRKGEWWAAWASSGARAPRGLRAGSISVPGGALLPSGRVLRAGDTDAALFDEPLIQGIWSDGAQAWLLSQDDTLAGADGLPLGGERRAAEDKDAVLQVRIADGARIGRGLPSWIAGLLGPEPREAGVDKRLSFLLPVPAGAEQSPLGAAHGLGGWAGVKHGDGRWSFHGIDGRQWTGLIDGHRLAALMRFPERPALYPVVWEGFKISIFLPDGQLPLTPIEDDLSPRYWGGGPQPLAVAYWHLLRPRDPAGSRALASCTLDAARALLDAARQAVQAGAGDVGDPPETTTDYGDMVATLSGPKSMVTAEALWPAVTAVACAHFPAISHPRLLRGLVRMAVVAAELDTGLERLRVALRQRTAQPASRGLTVQDARAFAELHNYGWDLWWNRPHNLLGQQLQDVASFFLSAAVGEGRVAADCNMDWFALATETGALLWRLLAVGTPAPRRAELAALLQAWVDTGLPAHHARLRLVELRFVRPPVAGLDNDHPDHLLAWENRYFLRLRQIGHPVRSYTMMGLEYSADGVFRVPPGAALVSARPMSPVAPDTITDALALLQARGPCLVGAPPLLAAQTGLLPASAAVLWAGASGPWEAGKEVREALGLKAAAIETGRDELRWHPVAPVYAAAFPASPEDLYAAPERVAAALAQAWVDHYGARTPLDEAVCAQLVEDFRDSQRAFDLDTRTLMDPALRPMLTVDLDWVVPPPPSFGGWGGYPTHIPPGWPTYVGAPKTSTGWPDPAQGFTSATLRLLLRYLPWAHQELPVGHPVRVGAGRLAALLHARLQHPSLLIFLAGVKRVGGDGAGMIQRMQERLGALIPSGAVVATWPDEQDGYYLALRPSRLSDDLRALLQSTLSGPPGGPLRYHAPPHEAFDSGEVGFFLLWASAGMQAIAAELMAPSLPTGARLGDPRQSAPEAVAALQARYDISAASAAVYLQHAALAEPTEARVLRFNQWSRSQLRDAVAPLLSRGLLVEARYPRCPRALFLPGPIALLPAPAMPIEASKLALYGLDTGSPDELARRAPELHPPFGVVLPVEPLPHLFARVGGSIA